MLKKALLLALLVLHASSICQASVSDAGIGEYHKKEQELYQERAAADKDTVVNKSAVGVDKPGQDGIKVVVNRIVTSKSAILKDEEINAITAKYEGRELQLSDLHQAIAEINALYTSKGYITAKALLPPQKIENGVVKIQLVEGRFGEFLIEGNRHTASSYIKDRLSVRSGDLVKLDRLQKDIVYFNNTNDIRIRAELRPGKEFGTTDCVLRVNEPDQWQTTLFADNAGRDESGLYRFGMTVANNSLFGNREVLMLNPTWTNGTLAGSMSYSAPVGRLGTRIGLSYSKNQVNIISGPYESMDIQGDSSDVGLTVSHPMVVKANRKVEGYLELHSRDSSTDFFGNSLLESKAKTLTLGSNIRTTDNKGLWFSQFSITGINASKKDAYNDREFWRLNLSAIRQLVVDTDKRLIWRLAGQLTDDREMPSSEQFSLGGMSSVKGFNEGLLSGDQGYYAGVEYNFPLQSGSKLNGLVFLDHGRTYNDFSNGEHSKDTLTSIGVGVIVNLVPNYFGKIVVGFPLDSSKEHDKARIHFFLQSSIR